MKASSGRQIPELMILTVAFLIIAPIIVGGFQRAGFDLKTAVLAGLVGCSFLLLLFLMKVKWEDYKYRKSVRMADKEREAKYVKYLRRHEKRGGA